MATQAKLGKLLQFKRGDGGSPETFTLVPECAGTITIGEESPEVDVTNFDSTASEFIPDLATGTMIEIEGNYIGHAQQDGLRTDCQSQVNRNFQIYHPGWSKTYSVTVACLSWSHIYQPKGAAVKFTFKGRITGSVTVA